MKQIAQQPVVPPKMRVSRQEHLCKQTKRLVNHFLRQTKTNHWKETNKYTLKLINQQLKGNELARTKAHFKTYIQC